MALFLRYIYINSQYGVFYMTKQLWLDSLLQEGINSSIFCENGYPQGLHRRVSVSRAKSQQAGNSQCVVDHLLRERHRWGAS